MNRDDISALVAIRMEQADETLRDAVILLKAEPRATRSVINRTYYAAFYAVPALLQTVEKTPEKHKGVLLLFDREFVHTGKFPKEMSESLHKLFLARMEDDYKRTEPILSEEAQESISIARRFIEEIRKYLIGEGFYSVQNNSIK